MKGFGAFREWTDIDLADVDLVALVGPTGSGKSTIIDAITFALYGTVARYENNQLVAPAINQTSNEARVSLEFGLDGQILTATRIVRRTTSGRAATREARLERGDHVLAGDVTSMSQEVKGLLGLDVEQFNRTVVLPQGKFATFLHDNHKDRQSTLVRLLGMEWYRRIGAAARGRAAWAKAQTGALRANLASETRHLTDERRAALEHRVTQLDTARTRFKADLEAINDLDNELHNLDDGIRRLSDQIDRMESVVAPDGVAELADQITNATRERTDAEENRRRRSTERLRAKEALRDGPDIATVRLGLEEHAKLAQQSREYDDVAKRLDTAVREYASAKRAADRVQKEQTELDRCVEEAREAERTARTARETAVTTTQVDTWSKTHSRYSDASKHARATDEAVRSAEESMRPLEKALRDAESAASGSSARVDDLRQRAGILGHVHLLEVGSDCPLCLQEVHELPAHDLDTELRQAEAHNAVVLSALDKARQACKDAEAVRMKRRAEASSALKALGGYEADIASIPPSNQLGALRTKAVELEAAVGKAKSSTQQAETAARQHRESAAHAKVIEAYDAVNRQMNRLRGSKDTLESELTSLRNRVLALPREDALHSELAKAERLEAELREADGRFEDAETEYQGASAQLAAVDGQREQAIELFHASRAQIAEFEPPIADTTDLVRAWTTLTEWTQREARAGATKHGAAAENKSVTEQLRAERLANLRDRCVHLLDNVATDATVSELGDLLTEHAASAAANLKHFDEERHRLENLRKQIAYRTEQAEVADELGYLLHADRFGGWLMEAAMEVLVEPATARLLELSGGQYSLEVQQRDFAVRDHTNADELRMTRTLSGGETFLASLSLALALADATAEIAAEGAPRMESIFLDEGFGTLDPHTLDTVATAVEELGTTGRFVGIVTHIRELADRMPVRLEVTKTGGAATVERIET
ncbi:AAA family ATPase [Candidatus Spongiisocius sp.]|uniref:AAA family ATPase n=1 Tax=Candidatus Spongiisocius sp. TaxID=3101273 RepID=UPI003B5C7F16